MDWGWVYFHKIFIFGRTIPLSIIPQRAKTHAYSFGRYFHPRWLTNEICLDKDLCVFLCIIVIITRQWPDFCPCKGLNKTHSKIAPYLNRVEETKDKYSLIYYCLHVAYSIRKMHSISSGYAISITIPYSVGHQWPRLYDCVQSLPSKVISSFPSWEDKGMSSSPWVFSC